MHATNDRNTHLLLLALALIGLLHLFSSLSIIGRLNQIRDAVTSSSLTPERQRDE